MDSRRLEALRIGWSQPDFLNGDGICRITKSCYNLERIEISADEELRRLDEIPLRRAFQNQFQEKKFGHWLDEFVEIVRTSFHRIEINLEKIRRTPGFNLLCETLEV
jgi:hypothetical protein